MRPGELQPALRPWPPLSRETPAYVAAPGPSGENCRENQTGSKGWIRLSLVVDIRTHGTSRITSSDGRIGTDYLDVSLAVNWLGVRYGSEGSAHRKSSSRFSPLRCTVTLTGRPSSAEPGHRPQLRGLNDTPWSGSSAANKVKLAPAPVQQPCNGSICTLSCNPQREMGRIRAYWCVLDSP
jgi:hypothetical protein